MSSKFGTAITVACVLVGVVGCTTGPKGGHRSDEPTSLSIEQSKVAVEGVDYEVVGKVPSTIGPRYATYISRAGKSSAIYSVAGYGPDTDPEKDAAGVSYLVSRNEQTGDLRTITRSRDDWGVSELVVSGNEVVFIETSADSYESFPWRLYVADWTTGSEKKLIASFEDFGIKDPPWPSSRSIRPQVVGKFVYFGAVDKVDGEDVSTSVFRVPLGGSAKPELVVSGATDVYADGEKIRVQMAGGELRQWDPALDKGRNLDGAEIPATCGSFFNEGVAVACSGKAKRLRISSSKHGDFVIDTGNAQTGYLNATRRWVTFSTESQAYVVDLLRGRVMRLKGSERSPTRPMFGNELMYVRQEAGRSKAQLFPMIKLLPAS